MGDKSEELNLVLDTFEEQLKAHLRLGDEQPAKPIETPSSPSEPKQSGSKPQLPKKEPKKDPLSRTNLEGPNNSGSREDGRPCFKTAEAPKPNTFVIHPAKNMRSSPGFTGGLAKIDQGLSESSDSSSSSSSSEKPKKKIC